jgi:Ca2+-binding RTX toxin-like protein
MNYHGRTTKVVADADGVADDGAAGEGDDIGVDVEGIVGGDAGDELTATDASDGVVVVAAPEGQGTAETRLIGGPGADSLTGSDAASDDLIGGPDVDGLFGRSGNDFLEAQGDGGFDDVECGPGVFDFAKLDLVDGFGSGCETVQIAAVGRHPTVAFSESRAVLAAGTLRVGLSCPRGAAGACRGTLEGAGATAAFAVRRGAKRTVRVKLGAAAAKRVRKAGRVRLTATEHDAEGRPKTSRTVLKVR